MIEDGSVRVPLICELLAETLKLSGRTRLRVFGTSMLPSVWPGDELEIQSGVPLPAIGKIVLFARDGRLFAHRVVAQRKSDGMAELVTRGDALTECDPPITITQVLGHVIAIRRCRRPVPLTTRRGSLATRIIGRALREGSPLRRTLLKLHAIRVRACA